MLSSHIGSVPSILADRRSVHLPGMCRRIVRWRELRGGKLQQVRVVFLQIPRPEEKKRFLVREENVEKSLLPVMAASGSCILNWR
jgi:hypothetical protein